MNIKGYGGINPNDLKAQQNAAKADKANKSNETARSGGDPSASGATVQLSSQAQNLKQIEKSLVNLPEVNQAKVDELKQKVQSGEYSVNSKNVAEKLLGFEGDL